MKEIEINTEYITLGQFLKLADIISTGGQAKYYLSSDVSIFVNGEEDHRRGKKLRVGDEVVVAGEKYKIILK